jgi:hypothetical protein
MKQHPVKAASLANVCRHARGKPWSDRRFLAPCRRLVSRGIWAAVLAAVVAVPASWAAPPVKPAGMQPRRFLDSLLARPPQPQKFIAVPQPPKMEEVVPAKKEAKVAAVPPSAKTSAPTRLPTWEETTTFTVALSTAVQQAARHAIDPGYRRPQKQPVAANRPEANPYAVKKPTGKPAPRTRRLEALRGRIARTLATYQRRPLNTAEHTPWEVMHGFIAFGIPTQVRVGGPAGDPVNAIGWMNMGGRCRGQVMLVATDNRLTALRGIGVQGHSAQYLAILAQCRVGLDSPIDVQSKSFTVADLVEEEKLSCKAGTELTFALIGLAHYLPTDAEWTARDDEKWSLARLVEEEIEQPIRGAPCGGTHRLFGLSYGCQRRLRATGRLDGVYLRASKYVRDYQTFTLNKMQNPDGSFSTEWFKYPADREDDIDRKVQTTGLVSSLDQETLYHNRVVAAAEFLTAALAREPSREWKIGPLGHALHALTIYQERVWGQVLPGGVAAYHGPMKAAPERLVADRPATQTIAPVKK